MYHTVLVEPRCGGIAADLRDGKLDRRVNANGAPFNGGGDVECFGNGGHTAAGTKGNLSRKKRRASGRGVVRGAGSSSNATPLRWWLHLLLVFGFSCIMHDGDHRISDRTNEHPPLGALYTLYTLYTGHAQRGGLLLAEAYPEPNNNYPQKKYDFESWPDYQFTRRYPG